MQIRKKHIPIFTAVSDDTLPYLAPTLRSISNFANGDSVYDVRVITASLAPYNYRRLRHFDLPGVDVSIVDISDNIEEYHADFGVRLTDLYCEESFYPFFLAPMYQRITKALFVECGTVFKTDPDKILCEDIGESLIGGFLYRDDCIDFCRYVEKWVGVCSDSYVDPALMIMNFSALRKHRAEEKFTRIITGYNFDSANPAADYLNFLCKGAVRILDKDLDGEREKPALTFKPYKKPWLFVNGEESELFWDLARKTPFYEDIRDAYLGFNETQKQRIFDTVADREAHIRALADSTRGFYATLGDNYILTKK